MLHRLPGCPAARLPGCPAARLPGCPAARLPGCPADRRSFVAGPPETIDRLVKLVTAAQWIEPQVRRLTPVSLGSVGW
ncbi:hypothetical protein AB0H28_24805 [Micromonospora sp. NPDC050980]|uniref:hypothetical protein n=1 Tax=Micromonospora sp. NPDC050980 TaxID=3155161 RepID=UPI0033E6BEA4